MMMIYGLGVKEMSLEEIGNKFGVTSERIRQIKERVLQTFRDRYKNVDEFLNV